MTNLGHSINNQFMNQNSMMGNATQNNNQTSNATFDNSMPPPANQNMMVASQFSSMNSFQQTGNMFSQQANAGFAPSRNTMNMEKPKRPLSAYEHFCQERKRMVALTDAQLQLIWKERMDAQQKDIYVQQARIDRQRYIAELKVWKAQSEHSQPAGAVSSFLKSSLQGSSKMNLVEANKRGRLQPAIVSCPNLNASPSLRLQAQQQMQFQAANQQNATFDNIQMMRSSSQHDSRPRSRFVANQLHRLQQGQGLAGLASEFGEDGTTAFASSILPRSQSASVVQGNSLRFQHSSPNLSDNLMDPLMEFPGF
jgi:hypothetical protein